ncbi:MAG: hypothetical protein RLY35_69 [Bacteroidota bacterium]|jgi:hypothetical protein
MEKLTDSKNGALSFPSWKQVISELLIFESKFSPHLTMPVGQFLGQFIEKMDLIKEDIENKSASISLQMMIRAMARYQNDESLISLMEKKKNFESTRNEFQTIFNIEESRFEWVSPNIEKVLGLKESEFSLEKLIGLGQDPLIVKEDLQHFIRWAGISYLLFSIPGFSFESNNDYQVVSFRINTKNLQNHELHRFSSLTLQKKSQLHIGNSDTLTNGIPKYHFDTWSLFESVQNHYVKPNYVTNFHQSQLMNNLGYVINAILLDFPIKYLLILNERSRFDRNKLVAHSINEKCKKHANVNANLDENKIGDTINKTIKPKLTNLAKNYCPELTDDIQGDLEAVTYATKCGLLPIPQGVEEIIYKCIDNKA